MGTPLVIAANHSLSALVGHGSRLLGLLGVIEQAYTLGEQLGLEVWCEDEAGPFQTAPIPGASWQPQGQPTTYPHEYLRDGTAKLLTLFHPRDGQVRVKGVTNCTNAMLLPWLPQELDRIVAALPGPVSTSRAEDGRARWARWQAGLQVRITLPADPPPLRMLLVLDNLIGHKNPEFMCWCFARGIMLLYTPLGGSWLNMAESIQRILKRRALEGTQPTPFIWGGKRAARRSRQRQRRHAQGGSGACTRRPIRRRRTAAHK